MQLPADEQAVEDRRPDRVAPAALPQASDPPVDGRGGDLVMMGDRCLREGRSVAGAADRDEARRDSLLLTACAMASVCGATTSPPLLASGNGESVASTCRGTRLSFPRAAYGRMMNSARVAKGAS